MSSTVPIDHEAPDAENRSTKARIRDAAIGCFAEHGTAATTARKVAAAAGVSPGLVIHHFASMDGLRAACDEYVAGVIRRQKAEAMTAGTSFDILASLRETGVGPLAAYLAKALTDDSPAVVKLVDDLVADAEAYLQQGVDAGTLRPTPNANGRAVVLAMWSLGALVLHEHVHRLLGVDLTDPAVGADPAIAAYVAPAYEILGGGIFTEAFTAHIEESLSRVVTQGATNQPRIIQDSEGPT